MRARHAQMIPMCQKVWDPQEYVALASILLLPVTASHALAPLVELDNPIMKTFESVR